jgi:hypothetical protein
VKLASNTALVRSFIYNGMRNYSNAEHGWCVITYLLWFKQNMVHGAINNLLEILENSDEHRAWMQE